jgi:hypothetical protein
MKGAMSSVPSTLWQTLCHHLFPTSTYHYNSGGDPAHIPDLSYEQLKAFYKSHYHPSNAIFMTFGDIPAAEHQAVFRRAGPHAFRRLDERIAVTPSSASRRPCGRGTLRLTTRRALRAAHAYRHGLAPRRQHGPAHNCSRRSCCRSVLLENSASPLQQALETTELGTAPSPLCGLEDSMRESCSAAASKAARPSTATAHSRSWSWGDRRRCPRRRSRGAARGRAAPAGAAPARGQRRRHALRPQPDPAGAGTGHALRRPDTRDGPRAGNRRPAREDSRPDYIRDLAHELLLDNPHRVTPGDDAGPDAVGAAPRARARAPGGAERQSLDDASSRRSYARRRSCSSARRRKTTRRPAQGYARRCAGHPAGTRLHGTRIGRLPVTCTNRAPTGCLPAAELLAPAWRRRTG